jgi:hypothetical protein
MKTRTFLAAMSLSFMAACAQISPRDVVDTPVIEKAVQNGQTPNDHYALTKYFEGAAREMQVKAAEKKKLLEHYEDKSYLYGREAQDLISHTAAMVRRYNETAREDLKEAAAHRRMAMEEAARAPVVQDAKIAGSAFMEGHPNSN